MMGGGTAAMEEGLAKKSILSLTWGCKDQHGVSEVCTDKIAGLDLCNCIVGPEAFLEGRGPKPLRRHLVLLVTLPHAVYFLSRLSSPSRDSLSICLVSGRLRMNLREKNLFFPLKNLK